MSDGIPTADEGSPYRTGYHVDAPEESPYRTSDPDENDASQSVILGDASLLLSPPGSVPEPDPNAGSGEYTTDEDITVDTSPDPEHVATPGADGIDDAVITANETAEDVRDWQQENNVFRKLKAVLAIGAVVGVLYLLRPILTVIAGVAE